MTLCPLPLHAGSGQCLCRPPLPISLPLLPSPARCSLPPCSLPCPTSHLLLGLQALRLSYSSLPDHLYLKCWSDLLLPSQWLTQATEPCALTDLVLVLDTSPHCCSVLDDTMAEARAPLKVFPGGWTHVAPQDYVAAMCSPKLPVTKAGRESLLHSSPL